MNRLRTFFAAAVFCAGAARAGLDSNSAVFVILMENHNWADIKGSASAPYINNVLLPMGAHAEQYYNPSGIHPSLPNYLWLEAGQNFGILDDNPPANDHQSSSIHLATQLGAAGILWRAYAEDITGATCPLADNYPFAVRHLPFGLLPPHWQDSPAARSRQTCPAGFSPASHRQRIDGSCDTRFC